MALLDPDPHPIVQSQLYKAPKYSRFHQKLTILQETEKIKPLYQGPIQILKGSILVQDRSFIQDSIVFCANLITDKATNGQRL